MMQALKTYIFDNTRYYISLLSVYHKQNNLSITNQTNQKSYNYSDREKEIKNQFVDFPPGLENIIIGYDACEFKKTMIQFNNVIPENPNDINFITKYYFQMDHYYEKCKDLISGLTKLNNNHIVTVSFTGLICIWDHVSGILIKKIKSIEEKITKKSKYTLHKKKICQISDNIIAVHDSGYEIRYVYIILMDQDIVHEMDNENGNIYFHHIVSFTSNQLITVSYIKDYYWSMPNTVNIWNIKENDTSTKIELHKIHHLQFDLDHKISFVHIDSSSKDTLIILGKKYYSGNILIQIDIATKMEIKRIYFKGRVTEHPSIIDNNLLISCLDNGKFNHRLINCNTFQQTDTLDQIHDQIYKIIKMKNDIYLISTIRYTDPNMEPEIPDIQINTLHFPTQSIIQTFQTDQSIRDICEYKNGFLTLTSTFQINTYDCL